MAAFFFFALQKCFIFWSIGKFGRLLTQKAAGLPGRLMPLPFLPPW